MSPARNEPASSSATVKQETTQPLNAIHTILAIQNVTLHPTAMASKIQTFPIFPRSSIKSNQTLIPFYPNQPKTIKKSILDKTIKKSQNSGFIYIYVSPSSFLKWNDES